MKKTKLATAALGIFALLGYATVAFASPSVYHVNITPDTGPDYVGDIPVPTFDGHTVYLVGLNPTSGAPTKFYLNRGFSESGGELNVFDVPSSAIQTLDNFKFDTNTSLTNMWGYLASATSTISTNSSDIGSLNTSVGITNALNTQINANLFGTSTTMTAQAASTTNGLMTQAQSDKLDAMASNLAWSWATSTRSIVTGTGATGFQVSASRNQTVHYNVKVTTTASIAGNADGYVTLEVAPTNSATAGDWVEMARCGNSQALTLAITLQSVQGTTCGLVGDIPAGYYTKLRSVTTTGTVSFTYLSGQEVLK